MKSLIFMPFVSGTIFWPPYRSHCRFKFHFPGSKRLPLAITKRRTAIHTVVKSFEIPALICRINQLYPAARQFHRPIAQLEERIGSFAYRQTGPFPVSGIFYETCTKRISLDITQNSKIMTIFLNRGPIKGVRYNFLTGIKRVRLIY